MISRPSSRTRSEIWSAPNAIRLTGRPSRRGSSTAGGPTVEPFTEIPDNRSAGPFGRRTAAANTRNPYDLVIREHDGPACAAGPGNPRIAEIPFHTSCRLAFLDPHPVARAPRADREAPIARQLGEPFAVPPYASGVTRRFIRRAGGCGGQLARHGTEAPPRELDDPHEGDLVISHPRRRRTPQHERVSVPKDLDATR